jgi:hypothetical protein
MKIPVKYIILVFAFIAGSSAYGSNNLGQALLQLVLLLDMF